MKTDDILSGLNEVERAQAEREREMVLIKKFNEAFMSAITAIEELQELYDSKQYQYIWKRIAATPEAQEGEFEDGDLERFYHAGGASEIFSDLTRDLDFNE